MIKLSTAGGPISREGDEIAFYVNEPIISFFRGMTLADLILVDCWDDMQP